MMYWAIPEAKTGFRLEEFAASYFVFRDAKETDSDEVRTPRLLSVK
jgi:hypothetical protein